MPAPSRSRAHYRQSAATRISVLANETSADLSIGLPLVGAPAAHCLVQVAHRHAPFCSVLEELVAGWIQNKISVDSDTAEWSRVAFLRMADIT